MSRPNVGSIMISKSENADVFRLLNDRAQSLSAAVVQLLTSSAGSRSWRVVVTGVACFVKDWNRKGFFIQVFDMDQRTLVFDQELYNEMVYRTPDEMFHTFEADNCVAGLSFLSSDEAQTFKLALEERLNKRKSRSMKRQSVPQRIKPDAPVIHEVSLQQKMTSKPSMNYQTSSVSSIFRTKKSKSTKEKLRKQDISAPSNMVHVMGIRGSANGFEMVNNMDQMNPEIAGFLKLAGLSMEALKNPAQREKIMAFVEENKVVEQMARKQSTRRKRRSPVSTPSLPPKSKPIIVHTVELNDAPNHQKHHLQQQQQQQPQLAPSPKPKRPPQRPQAPPPPPTSRGNVPPAPPPKSTGNAPPPPKPTGGAPPPPPPPPPPSAPGLPPPPAMKSPAEQKSVPKSNPRGNLLEEIRQKGGFGNAGLKSVDSGSSPATAKRPQSEHEQEDLTAVLQQALQVIQTANRSSDESDSDVDSGGSWSEDDC